MPVLNDIPGDVGQRASWAVNDVWAELLKAIRKYPPFNGCHEGYAVLLEEVDELWTEVKVKQGERDVDALKAEAIQVAAMALRFYIDCCKPGV